MSSHRFFLDQEAEVGQTIYFSPADAKQIRSVLRMKIGDIVYGVTPSGKVIAVELMQITPLTGLVRRTMDVNTEARARVVIAPALIKGDRFEWLVQKATELGVAAIRPWQAERCVVRLDGKEEKRLERWCRIAEEAAEQSGRTRVPDIFLPRPTDQLLSELLTDYADVWILLPWEEEKQQSLLAAVSAKRKFIEQREVTIVLFVGPEGGIAQSELSRFPQEKSTVVSLGPRILRSETAGITALSLIMGALGELGRYDLP